MKKSALLLILIIAVTACTEKGKPIAAHEGAVVKQETPTTESETVAVESPTTGAVNAQFDSASDPLTDVLLPLAARVLDPRLVRNEARNERQAQDDLINLNSLILRTTPEQRARAEFGQMLDRYIAAVETECSDIKSACIGLRYFRLAGNSFAVLKLAVPLRPAKAARLVLLAVELKNRVADNQLLELALTKIPGSQLAGDPKLKSSIESFLDTSLMLAGQSISDPAELRAFLERVRGWDLVNGKLWKLSTGAKQSLWSMMARARMIYATIDGRELHPELKALLTRATDPKDPHSFVALQNQLRKYSNFHPEALGARYVDKFDELFYLIDSVYLERMSSNDAAELFLGSGRSGEDMAAAIENYVRIRFTMNLRETSLEAKRIFNAPVASDQIYSHARAQSRLVQRVWSDALARMSLMRGFAALAIKPTPNGDALEKKVTALLDGYPRAINLVSTYPHILLLFHQMSKNNFSVYLPFLGDMDTSDLLSYTFFGAMPAILEYTDGAPMLNNFEILYAFDMAVRTGLFSTVGLDPDVFISDTLRRLTLNQVARVEFVLDRVKRRFQEARGIEDFRNACQEFKTGRMIPRNIALDELITSAYYGELMPMMFTMSSSKDSSSTPGGGALVKEETGLFFMDMEYSDAIELARLNIAQYMKTAEAMRASYVSYMGRYQRLNFDQILKRTEKTNAELKRLATLRERTITESRAMIAEYGDCYHKAFRRDWDVAVALMRAEEAYLRQVHRDIKKLRDPSMPEAEKAQLIASYQLKGMPGDFKGQDRLHADGYRASQLDFLIRKREQFKRGVQTERANIPPIAPHINVRLPSVFNLDTPLVRNSKQVSIMFVENEDEFVESAIKLYYRSGGEFNWWFGMSGSRLTTWTQYMKTLISLYRFEREPGRRDRPTITAEQVLQGHERILNLTKFTPEERWFFGITREAQRFDMLNFDNRVISMGLGSEGASYGLQDLWGIYDMPVRTMQFEKLGREYDQVISGNSDSFKNRLKHFGFSELGQLYHNVRTASSRGTPIVAYNPDLDRVLDASVRGFIQGEIASIRGFNAAAAEYAEKAGQRPAQDRPRADITTDFSITSPMLTDSLVPSWEGNLLRLRRATEGCLEATTPKCRSSATGVEVWK